MAASEAAILGVVTEFYLSGAPLIETGGADALTTGEFFDAKDAETVEAIKELIELSPPRSGGRRRRYCVQGVSRRRRLSQDERRLLRLPLLDRHPEAGNQNMLQHFLPDVQAVEQMEA